MVKARLSSRGQLALPKAVRDQLGLTEGDTLTVGVEGDAVILRKATAGGWREWDSRLKGSNLLADLAEERKRELLHDSNRP
jgi:AbrB family looped-hinge helix DNA binding protein